MLYSDHIWRYQGLICYILITSGDTKGCHGLSVEPSAPKQKIVAGYTCTFRGPGQYVDFIVTKCVGPIKCYVWGKIGGL